MLPAAVIEKHFVRADTDQRRHATVEVPVQGGCAPIAAVMAVQVIGRRGGQHVAGQEPVAPGAGGQAVAGQGQVGPRRERHQAERRRQVLRFGSRPHRRPERQTEPPAGRIADHRDRVAAAGQGAVGAHSVVERGREGLVRRQRVIGHERRHSGRRRDTVDEMPVRRRRPEHIGTAVQIGTCG